MDRLQLFAQLDLMSLQQLVQGACYLHSSILKLIYLLRSKKIVALMLVSFNINLKMISERAQSLQSTSFKLHVDQIQRLQEVILSFPMFEQIPLVTSHTKVSMLQNITDPDIQINLWNSIKLIESDVQCYASATRQPTLLLHISKFSTRLCKHTYKKSC